VAKWEGSAVASVRDLQELVFHPCVVTATKLNIVHEAHPDQGPFCRLTVDDSAPALPGVYAWVQDGDVIPSDSLCRHRSLTDRTLS